MLDLLLNIFAVGVGLWILRHLARIWRMTRTWRLFWHQLLYHEAKFLPYIHWKDKQGRSSDQ